MIRVSHIHMTLKLLIKNLRIRRYRSNTYSYNVKITNSQIQYKSNNVVEPPWVSISSGSKCFKIPPQHDASTCNGIISCLYFKNGITISEFTSLFSSRAPAMGRFLSEPNLRRRRCSDRQWWTTVRAIKFTFPEKCSDVAPKKGHFSCHINTWPIQSLSLKMMWKH